MLGTNFCINKIFNIVYLMLDKLILFNNRGSLQLSQHFIKKHRIFMTARSIEILLYNFKLLNHINFNQKFYNILSKFTTLNVHTYLFLKNLIILKNIISCNHSCNLTATRYFFNKLASARMPVMLIISCNVINNNLKNFSYFECVFLELNLSVSYYYKKYKNINKFKKLTILLSKGLRKIKSRSFLKKSRKRNLKIRVRRLTLRSSFNKLQRRNINKRFIKKLYFLNLGKKNLQYYFSTPVIYFKFNNFKYFENILIKKNNNVRYLNNM